MKKLTTIVAISLIALVGLFAENTANVQLNTSINDVNVTLSLLYANDVVINGQTLTENVDITKNGETKNFKLIGSYNKRKGETVNLEIETGEFLKLDDNSNVTEIGSGITPTISGITLPFSVTLDNGNHIKNPKTICTFKFQWTGDPDLDAGSYRSTSVITYSTE